MPSESEVFIHYFSGTGNTKRAVDRIAARLEQGGYMVSMFPIERGAADPAVNAPYNLIAFPVLSFAAPAMVKKYVRRLPDGKGEKAAVFAVCGGQASQALPQMARILARKGFDVFLTGGALYPLNWTQFVNPPDTGQAQGIIAGGDAMALAFAEDFRRGGRKLEKTGRLHGALARLTAILFTTLGRRFLGKAYIADANCNGCKICAESCPAGAIKMAGMGRKRPYWNFQCEDCGRCINICPRYAIQVSLPLLMLHLALNVGSIIAAILLANLAASHLPRIDRIPGWATVFAVSAALALALQVMLVDRFLFMLGNLPGLKKVMAWSMTKRYNRYLAPGFKPAAKNG